MKKSSVSDLERAEMRLMKNFLSVRELDEAFPWRLRERRKYRLDALEIMKTRTVREAARILGVNERTITRWRVRDGIATPAPRRIPEDVLNRAKAMLEEGYGYAEVRRTLRVSERALRRRFPGMGMDKTEAAAMGAATYKALMKGMRL